jgi:hypothetical protein
MAITASIGGPAEFHRTEAMMNKRIYDEASHVSAEEGEVIMDGPDGVAVSLTPRAAVETSDRLLEAAVSAQGQKLRARSSEQDNDEEKIELSSRPRE